MARHLNQLWNDTCGKQSFFIYKIWHAFIHSLSLNHTSCRITHARTHTRTRRQLHTQRQKHTHTRTPAHWDIHTYRQRQYTRIDTYTHQHTNTHKIFRSIGESEECGTKVRRKKVAEKYIPAYYIGCPIVFKIMLLLKLFCWKKFVK